VAGTYLRATRCPVYRRHDSHSGSRTELENLSNDAKGKGTSSEPARPKVPMRRAGADCSVIARKRGNARGAKGAGHRRWERANWQQEEPSFLDGRRRSSFGGTSRMMREYHVRICERLGVKLPGPTRHQAYRGQRAVIPEHAPKAQDFTNRRYRHRGIVDEVERRKPSPE